MKGDFPKIPNPTEGKVDRYNKKKKKEKKRDLPAKLAGPLKSSSYSLHLCPNMLMFILKVLTKIALFISHENSLRETLFNVEIRKQDIKKK